LNDRRPGRRSRPWVSWVVGVLVGFVILVATLVIVVIVHSRSNQAIVLPADGKPFVTSPPVTPQGATARYSQTLLRQGDYNRPISFVTPPDAKPGERLPAVIVVHGRDYSVPQELEAGGWDKAVTEDRFVAVFPQAEGGSWNAGGCCRLANTLGIGDVAFLEAIVSDLTRRPEIDPSRIFMVGDSNGGMLTYFFLCEHASQLAGAASIEGTNASGCEPNAAIPILHVAGTADQVVPYEGGRTAASVVFASGSFDPVPASVRAVAGAEGCAPAQVLTTAGTVKTETWAGCRDGSRVQLVTLGGAPHGWPTGSPYDATTESLRFFGIAA
jgi:polyhydroxybutyrate depolymerase